MNTYVDRLTAQDLAHLARSPTWRSDPERVEQLCLLVANADPMDCYSPSNPQHGTEYLQVLDRVVPGLDGCSTVEHVATLLRGAFDHYWGEYAAGQDWRPLAALVWLHSRPPLGACSDT